MAKKGPLGKAEKFYIDSQQFEYSAEELAIDLDRTVSSIRTYLKKHGKKKKPQDDFTVNKQFEYKKGATVMTENASTVSDTLKPSISSSDKSHCITKIKND